MSLGTEAKSMMKGAAKIGGAINQNIGFKALGLGVGAFMGVHNRVQQGDSYMAAIGKQSAEQALFAWNPAVAMAVSIAPAVVAGVQGAYRFRRQRHDSFINMKENAAGNTVGGNYMDTNAAMTMRQAAVQQIQGNKLNARSAIGGEARIFAGNAGYM